ncbi:tail protein X [Bacillus subtilis]|uniref:tail protein X n=1 Tax=Pseudochrobactrum asaccharolyticum TaxID=354351 RepID=UPI001F3751CE|nr:tail protein X [Pseudochrobactrum asaccharolyticum]MBX8803347.1 phage tail protein [Ochrobactrum sp. MR28]MBX8818946.1 phage tail protein [Ochrobactrum sp. MR31]MCF7646907.1 tail protein X [Pseudochrobactrum asaccharolyticum]MCF7673549.1 tail protein X [Bacillus subtilis]
MTKTYITRQGETVDLACWKHYGRTAEVTEAVLEANAGLADLGAILPMGTVIMMPVFESKKTARSLVGLWE